MLFNYSHRHFCYIPYSEVLVRNRALKAPAMANSDAVSRSADFTVHHSAPLILLGLAATLHEQRVSLYRTTFTELTGVKAPVFPERDAGHHAHTSSHVA